MMNRLLALALLMAPVANAVDHDALKEAAEVCRDKQ